MYKMITVGGKDYKIEFSIEASLYKDCADSVLNTMSAAESDISEMQISAMASLPITVLNMFHAGLLEHHGFEGDGSVKSIIDSKKILKDYMKENGADFNSVSNMLMKQMSEDGFFKLIGLDIEMNEQTETESKISEIPQDHKRKTSKAKPSEN